MAFALTNKQIGTLFAAASMLTACGSNVPVFDEAAKRPLLTNPDGTVKKDANGNFMYGEPRPSGSYFQPDPGAGTQTVLDANGSTHEKEAGARAVMQDALQAGQLAVGAAGVVAQFGYNAATRKEAAASDAAQAAANANATASTAPASAPAAPSTPTEQHWQGPRVTQMIPGGEEHAGPSTPKEQKGWGEQWQRVTPSWK